MQNKLRRILQKQDGIAILIVLCLGALLLAASLRRMRRRA